MIFDKRITPIRNDIAASEYKGFLKNRKFVKGNIYHVISNFSPLLASNKKQLVSQLLYGETVKVFEMKCDKRIKAKFKFFYRPLNTS